MHSVTSNPLRFQYDSRLCDSDAARLVFSFHHFSAQTLQGSNHDLNETFVTNCEKGLPKRFEYACFLGHNVSVVCDGSDSFRLTATCPQFSTKPSCEISTATFSTDTESDSRFCHVANFSNAETICVCDVCNGTRANKARRLVGSASNDVAFEIIEAVSSVQSSLQQFAVTMASASDFNSPEALKDALTVIFVFAVLWVGAAVGTML